MSSAVIISFEGLMGTVGRWLRRGLLNRVTGYKKHEFAWTSAAQHIHTGDKLVIIGHSFGVRSAVDTARLNKDNVKLLLLLDPRMPPWGTGGVAAPKGVRTVCIFQRGLMRGHPVDGAENIKLSGIGHTSIPATAEALEQLMKGLKS